MKRLCFGTLFKILCKASKSSVTDERLLSALFSVYKQDRNLCGSSTSHLKIGHDNVPEMLKSAASSMVHTVFDGKTILSVDFDRQNLSKVKYGYIDPDTLEQFKHNMDFDEANGFTPVSNFE